MATDANEEDQNCVEAFSLRPGYKPPEPMFRSDLMEPAEPEEKQPEEEPNMTDSDKTHHSRKRESVSKYEAELRDKEKEIVMLKQKLEGRQMTIQPREAERPEEEPGSINSEGDEDEQYRYLLEADESVIVNGTAKPPAKEAVDQGHSPAQPRSESSDTPSEEYVFRTNLSEADTSMLQRKLSEKEEELERKKSDASTLQRKLSEKEEELERKTHNVTTLERKLSEREEELERKTLALERKLSETQDELNEKQRENSKLNEEVRTAKRGGSARGRNSMDEKMHVRLNQTVGKCKELEKTLQLERDQVDSYKKQLDEMQRHMSKMQCDKEAKTDEQMQQYQKEKEEFEERMKHLQDDLENKSHDLAEEASKCKLYQEDLERKKIEMENQKEEFNREKGVLVKKKEELEQETERKTHVLRHLEQSLSQEKEEKTKIHSQVQVLLDENKAMRGENESYKTRVLALQQEKDKVEKETQDLCTKFQQEAEMTLLTYDQLKEKSDKDSGELLKQRQKLTGYMSRIEEMRVESSELVTANKKMANDVRTLTAEKQKLEKTVITLQDGILAVKLTADENETGFHAERDARTKDKATYEAKIRQMKMEIEDLNTKLQNLQSRNDSLARDKKHLMEQLNAFAATQCHDTFSS